MSLNQTRNAIGVLTEHLATQLTSLTEANTVSVGRPEEAAKTAGPKLNLFLYELAFDPQLRNVPLDQGQAPPLWLVLRFLMTAVDEDKESDASAALQLLGQGLLALRDLDFQRPGNLEALRDNPEPLKITFNDANVELLSSVMQGSDERYRLSAAFEVRPILLTSVRGAGGAPAIRNIGPAATPGVVVLPSMGPRLDRVVPEIFEQGDDIVLEGLDLAADQIEVCFGDICIVAPAAQVTNNAIRVTVPGPPAAEFSAGSHAVTVVKLLPSGRRFSSNAALGRLRPTLATAGTSALNTVATPAGGSITFGGLTLTGDRLGGPDDSIFVGFYAEGDVRLFEADGSPAQTSLTLSVAEAEAIPSGTYNILLRVNGEQAVNAPQVAWT